ncbi:MAG: hypothetical protein EBS06_09330, partial [Proteobacteria bacterium]|nr:hypothetical protein [Pseudomonadota bacterium]
PCPEDLIPQFAIVREAAESLNLAILEKTGVEADDIIATLAKKYGKDDMEVLVVSSDKDLMQLVCNNVKMYDAMKNRMIGDKEVEEKFAVAPNKVLDVLSLMGDTSDNIPGVKGIGPKTAAELIAQFGNLENIFENLHQIKQEKRRAMLQEGVENAKLSKILLALKDDVEMGISLKDLEVKAIDPHKLATFLERQGFRSLVERVKKEFDITNFSTASTNYSVKNSSLVNSAVTESAANLSNISSAPKFEVIDNFDKIKKTIAHKEDFTRIKRLAHNNGIIIIDYEVAHEELTKLTLAVSEVGKPLEEIFYFDVAPHQEKLKKNESIDLFNFDNSSHKTNENKHLPLDDLKEILVDSSIKKIFFDVKNFLRVFFLDNLDEFKNLEITGFEDISLINHLLNSSIKNDFRELIDLNLSEDIEARGFGNIFLELDKSRLPKEFEDHQKQVEFYCFKNYALWQLYKILSPKIISEKLSSSYQTYEKPLLPVLASIEAIG